MEVINPHRFAPAGPPAVDFDGFGNASRYFDGVSDYIDLGDSNDFSFGDSVNDSPFSVSAWVKAVDISAFRVLSKFSFTTAEWLFGFDSSDHLILYIWDSTFSNQRGAYTNTVYTSLENTWIHIAATYDGRGGNNAGDGVKLYLNGSEVTNLTRPVSNTYTAMHNTSLDLMIGVASNDSVYSNGHVADARLYNSELSSTDIAAIYGGENITTNLVGHWLKDTPSLLDHIGTNDGTNVGSAFAYDNPSPAVEFGKASRAFNGTSSSVDIPDNTDLPTGSQTWACWVKLDTVPNTIMDFMLHWAGGTSQASFALVKAQSTNKFAVYISSNGSSAAAISESVTVPVANTWYHVAAVYDASNSLKIYVNGTLENTNTTSIPASLHDSSAPLTFGNRSDQSFVLDGNLADCRIYDAALSGTDITALYNGTNVETNLIGHWLTNTDDVNDYAGSNDGTNNGSTYSFDNPLGDGGQYGSASREFSGTSQYITVSQNAFPTGDFSISMWAKRHTTDWYDYISIWDNPSSTNQKFTLMNRNFTDRLIFYYKDGSSTSYNVGDTGQTLSSNEWYHIGVTYEQGVAIKLFLNGTEDASTTTAPVLQSSTADIYIGGRLNTRAYDFDGNITDVRIYDTAITGTDMYDLSRGYDFRTNLVGQWLTNKDDVDDYAGSNNGTNTNTTYSQDAPL